MKLTINRESRIGVVLITARNIFMHRTGLQGVLARRTDRRERELRISRQRERVDELVVQGLQRGKTENVICIAIARELEVPLETARSMRYGFFE